MMADLEKTRFTIKLRRDQAVKLRLLRVAYQEKLQTRVTMTDFIESIMDSFLEDPVTVWKPKG